MSTEREAIDYHTPYDELVAEESMPMDGDLCLPGDGFFDWEAIQVIGNFAAENPSRWKTIALKLSEPGLSQAQIARRLGVTQQTVSRHLQKLKVF